MRLIVAVGIAFLMTGCSVYDLGKRVSRNNRSIRDLRALQAEQTEAIASLDGQIKLILGRMEELEFSHAKKMGGDLSTLKEDLTALRKRLPPPKVVPQAELEADQGWAITNLPEEQGQIFLDALGFLNEGKFSEAFPLLETVRNQLDSSDKNGPILYWLGVASDGLSDKKSALLAYSQCSEKHPKNHRAPGSLLRQAEVFVRLQDRKTAELSLKKLIKDYPKASEAPVARERLKQLR